MNNFSQFIFKILKSDTLIPIILIITYLIFVIVARGTLPPPEELLKTFARFYEQYGYEIIFVSALLESLILINLLVPGTVALGMGAVFASTGQVELTLVILTAFAGAILGYAIDYLLGYLGIGEILDKVGQRQILVLAKKQLKVLGTRGLILGFISPNVGAYLSLAAGALKLSLKEFLPIALISSLVWLTLWGLLFYFVGEAILTIVIKYWLGVFVVVFGGMILVKFWNRQESD
ncbi:MAG: DedA family protein [Candidatus Daviesbacteria bacterium]|nr:DedA family protein [Candidatus Daviesbacteria bacterium]